MEKKTRKDLEFENRYLNAVIKDLMDLNGIEDLEEFRGKAYCDKCLNTFESMNKKSAFRLFSEAFVLGVAIIFFLFFIAVLIGMYTLGK